MSALGALASALVVAAMLSASAARACSEQQVKADLRVLTATLDERARGALARMGGLGRRLLATRSYLRAGEELESRWSWTPAQFDAYQRSQEYTDLRGEIAKVSERFEALNPGYTLHVNLEPRSVDLQLALWNANRSVTRAATQLRKAALRERCGRGASSDPSGHARLRQFLIDWRPPVLPTLAAPGLSRHGQLRAFDFQVEQDGRIVAGPDSTSIATVWTAQGWTARLRAAVRSASQALEGPLEHPDEPWHYVYEP